MRTFSITVVAAVGLLSDSANAQLHFASLGGFGTGYKDQKAVATALKRNAYDPPLSFLVSPGSSFPRGVEDLNDKIWKTSFQDIYAGKELNMPLFVALGENDWQGNVTAMVYQTNCTYGKPITQANLETEVKIAGLETEKKETEHHEAHEAQNYRGPRWTLPNYWYHYTQTFPDVSGANSIMASPEISAFFVFIDTKILDDTFDVAELTSQHWDDLKRTLTAASRIYDWIIVIGDRSIYSSGSNGGSGYLKRHLRPLLRDNLVDAYISGSDADMEIIEDGLLTHITCGSAGTSHSGRMTSVPGSIAFSSSPGYCLHTLTGKHFTTALVDGYSGKIVKQREVPRVQKGRRFVDKIFNINRIPEVSFVPLPPGVGGAPGGIAGAAGRRPNRIFVIICGTIGLLLAAAVLTSAGATANKRFSKYQHRGQPQTSAATFPRSGAAAGGYGSPKGTGAGSPGSAKAAPGIGGTIEAVPVGVVHEPRQQI